MEHRRFDHLTKLVAAGGSRRAALRLLGGSALAAALARLGRGAAEAAPVGITDDRDANCRGSCAQCSGDGQCCSGRCEGGVCKCKQRGSCAHDRACCSGRCGGDGRCQRAPDPGCGICANPTSICDPDISVCDSVRDVDCGCLPTLSGGGFCSPFLACSGDRTTCRTNKDCRRFFSSPGAVCVPPAATKGCRGRCGGNGNACALPCEAADTRAVAAAEREGSVTFHPGDR